MHGQRKLTGHFALAGKVGYEVQKVNEKDVTFCESTKTICGGVGGMAGVILIHFES